MSPEEREIVKDHRKSRVTFDQIEEEVVQQEKKEQGEQLSLHNLAPVYNIK